MNIVDWNSLEPARRRELLARPIQNRSREIEDGVRRILDQIRADGDVALRALTRRYDGCELPALEVDAAEFARAEAALSAELKQAIAEARARIERFHRESAPQPVSIETAPGVRCERMLRPIGRVGLYVPAGTAPLPSTALMLGVPAALAGCREVILCTPATQADGSCDPAVLYAARLCGVSRVFKLGGAQAIAAMAFGTDTLPKCDKLFGPGNAWVTEAKRQVEMAPDGCAIDMPAGPSEVLIVADDGADPEFVAADLLSQAEHGPDSQVVLLSPSAEVLDATTQALDDQLLQLPRAEIALRALSNSRLVRVESLEQALEISNGYAPEHLILNVREPRRWLEKVENAGSVFLGAWSPEAVGDYCSGTNHVLPTYGFARAWSGVSVASFLKLITVQELSREGLRAIGPCAATLAQAERLAAHERAVTVRLERLEAA